jgi:hypothetical protein
VQVCLVKDSVQCSLYAPSSLWPSIPYLDPSCPGRPSCRVLTSRTCPTMGGCRVRGFLEGFPVCAQWGAAIWLCVCVRGMGGSIKHGVT